MGGRDERSGGRDRDRERSRSPGRGSSSRYDDSRDSRRTREREDSRERDSKRSRREQDTRREGRSSRDDNKPAKVRETSTERAARKAMRKTQKAADAALLLPPEARLAAAEVSFYSSTDNPFHDANLGDKFVWGKKREKERKEGISVDEARRRDSERAMESKREIERLNTRRAEREIDLQLREEESARAARMSESAQMSAWIDREDDFHLEQSKKRAEIRVRERRAKAIDYLALNLKWSLPAKEPGEDGYEEEEEDDGVGLEVDMEEPYAIFDNLTLEDSEELHEDIKMYLSLEKLESNLDFWRSLLIVSSSSLESLRLARSIGPAAYATQQLSSASLKNEITKLLSSKTFDQLILLQNQVQRKLTSGENVDVDYWEGLLKELVVWKAKGRLRDMHEIVLNNRLEQLRRKQRDEALRYQDEVQDALKTPGMETEGEVKIEVWDESLEPVQHRKIPDEMRLCEVVDAKADLEKLYALRRAVVQTRFVSKQRKLPPVAVAAPASVVVQAPAALGKDEEIYQLAVGQGFDEEEELFNLEVEMSRQAYTWEDKYRPRKPRYFNKVHTGYEWNKYNQTHYDTDNPPPKVVQGYKFNIFYPDLIDTTKAPTYKIVREKGNDDTSTLLFTAGAPYQDIAYTIVHNQWEYSHKRGFRSSFDRGVLQLYFQFKRDFYRK